MLDSDSISALFRRSIVAMVVFAVVVSSPSCRRTSAPSLLLVTIDTLRADHCSAYGYGIDTTPVLAGLARNGMLVRTALSPTATTGPSHAAVLTGVHPGSLGVGRNGVALPAPAFTLAERLAAAGYSTAAFVSSVPLASHLGFSQGFEVYDDNFELATVSLGRSGNDVAHDRVGAKTLELAQSWLAAGKDRRPFFLWVHFVDPHGPYRAPQHWLSGWPAGTPKYVRDYDDEVAYADRLLGGLVAAARNRSGHAGLMIAVTADHGEGLMNHGWMNHGLDLYQEAVHVPMVVVYPPLIEPGVIVGGLRTSQDLTPTLAAMLAQAGVEINLNGFEGHDLRKPVVQGPIFMSRRSYRRRHYRGRDVNGPMYSVVERARESQGRDPETVPTWKLIFAPGEDKQELFDLSVDPGETTNVAEANAVMTTHLSRLASRRSKSVVSSQASGIRPADKEALRSLGYLD